MFKFQYSFMDSVASGDGLETIPVDLDAFACDYAFGQGVEGFLTCCVSTKLVACTESSLAGMTSPSITVVLAGPPTADPKTLPSVGGALGRGSEIHATLTMLDGARLRERYLSFVQTRKGLRKKLVVAKQCGVHVCCSVRVSR